MDVILHLETDAKECAGTPFGLPRVVIIVAQERGVEEEGGTSKVFLAEVIDDGSAGVGDHLGEMCFSVALHTILFDVDVAEDNQARLGRSMEEPFACHEVVAVTTTDGKCIHGSAYMAHHSGGIISGLDSATLISGTYEP